MLSTTLVATGAAGVVGAAPDPAAAAAPPPAYGLQGTAYGTRVTTAQGLESGRIAFSHVSCTQRTGRRDDASLATLALPADNPLVHVDGVASHTRTYAAPRRGVASAVESVNRISSISLGSPSTPRLAFRGLRTKSTAWATTDGKLRTANDFTAGQITLTNLPDGPLTNPLRDLLGALTGGIDEVLAVLVENGGTIEIPGLGQVSVGFDDQRTRAGWALASAFVLRVKLYAGPGADDDTMVALGRTYARISSGQTAGVMNGLGWGASGQLLDGTVNIGELGDVLLPCQGTGGKVRRNSTAGLDLPAAGLRLGALEGTSFGVQRPDGSATATTSGSLASITLGPLEIRGIRGQVNVAQNRRGRILGTGFRGSRIGEILLDGKSLGGFGPGQAAQIPALEVPGVAKIEFFQRAKWARGGRISTVVITLLSDTPGSSEIRLGNARASIARR